MPSFQDTLKKVYVRTSVKPTATYAEERQTLYTNIKNDLANITEQINKIYYPLFEKMVVDVNLNPLDYGLSGNVVVTDVTAKEGSSGVYYDTSKARANTVKETIDVLLAEIARVENLVGQNSTSEVDLSGIESELGDISANLRQLAKDTMGPSYAFDNDGNANLIYSLAQAIDAIGAFFVGFPTTGNTYTTSYPSMTLVVNLSDINIDTTLPQATITDLGTDLDEIRTFIGMNSEVDVPNYSGYNIITTVVDGESLEESIAKLDAAVAAAGAQTLQEAYDAGGVATSGEILMTNLKGPIKVIGGAGMSSFQQWLQDGSPDVIRAQMSNDAHTLYGIPLTLQQAAADPATTANSFMIYSKASAGMSELFGRGTSGNVIQVTRNQRVKELEVGCDWIPAAQLQHVATPPTNNTIAPVAGTALAVLEFGGANPESAFINIGLPRDEDGLYPTRFTLQLYSMPTTNIGGAGQVYGFELYTHDTNNVVDPVAEIFANTINFNPVWSSQGFQWTSGFTMPGDQYDIQILTWSNLSVGTGSVPGLVCLKLTRDPSNGSDTYNGGTVAAIGARITWYR